MAKIKLTGGFKPIEEGVYVFRIYEVDYDETFGKILVKLVTATGATHTERFSILTKDGTPNEGALNAFSYFAKNALNDFSLDDVDPADLVDHYIRAEVEHTVVPSNREAGKTVTFVNLGDKSPADGFDTEPTERAVSLGHEEKQTDNTVDLDALLG